MLWGPAPNQTSMPSVMKNTPMTIIEIAIEIKNLVRPQNPK